MENLDPPFPQNQKWEIARFCPFRGFILDLGGTEFAIPFYSVQDCSYETFFAYWKINELVIGRHVSPYAFNWLLAVTFKRLWFV